MSYTKTYLNLCMQLVLHLGNYFATGKCLSKADDQGNLGVSKIPKTVQYSAFVSFLSIRQVGPYFFLEGSILKRTVSGHTLNILDGMIRVFLVMTISTFVKWQ